ncbi:hypothetical protein ABZ490_50405 [Streptomyces sp. NPDC005811]|uniref:hypothetical protein n=1 Tax=Streptomyces sp. NPDC005811 TaxID=3154565 RepID=UPI0033F9F4BA
MAEPEVTERIAARRAEWDDLEEQVVKQLAEVWAEREDLAAAERVPARPGRADRRGAGRDRACRRSGGRECGPADPAPRP